MCGGNHGARVADAAMKCQKKRIVSKTLDHLPAFRFRYSEENVIREPRSTPIYAKGSISPFQSISNMIALFSLFDYKGFLVMIPKWS
jgi:hypothetical protein